MTHRLGLIDRLYDLWTITLYVSLNLKDFTQYIAEMHPSEMTFDLLSVATQTADQKIHQTIINSKVSQLIHDQGF